VRDQVGSLRTGFGCDHNDPEDVGFPGMEMGSIRALRKVPIRRLRFCREQSNALEAVCFHSYTKFLHVVSEAGAKLLSWRVRWGEIARLREALCDSFAGGRTFEIPPESLEDYFFSRLASCL